ncbi:alpha/beta fold hydrolase [Antrihabitans sp. YC2-6]|uniref:alpha/beta fold hydrolase n=1 Tax=Antrihabitans sp. YC2-6 TaxID=2799498 RepID=UPI0018F512FC|nr:alpha/beta hydrolase [Antrihabitans sp. YC2-6]MBJ8345042.1 alpha/beta hydrolase [Antrihabitans sp. YC2-6]
MPDPRTRSLRPVPHGDTRVEFHTIHGYRRAYRIAGSGPAVLLIHGIGDSSAAWIDLIPHLAEKYTVIAPDLLGHGRSDKPRADYSVAAYANGMHDLLAVLGIDTATIVGHSLGGAVAMQFAYQYPQKVDRLVLVSTSGVTKDIHALLRVTSVPLVSQSLRLLGLPGAKLATGMVGSALARLRRTALLPDALGDTSDLLRMLGGTTDPTAFLAFLKTLRAVVDWRGQAITLLDRCYLNEHIPVQIIWGAKDSVFPVSHAYLAHTAMPGSRVEIFNRTGHYPFLDDPVKFLGVVEEFLAATEPARFEHESWRAALAYGSVAAEPATALAVVDAVGDAERSAT